MPKLTKQTCHIYSPFVVLEPASISKYCLLSNKTVDGLTFINLLGIC